MKYSIAVISSLAATGLAVAPKITNTNFAVEKGKPFTVTWEGCDAGCTISLQNGPSTNTKDVDVLTRSASGGSFTFTPPDNLPSDFYNFQIKNAAGEPNYSEKFNYVGTGAAPANPSSSDLTSSITTTTDLTSSLSTISPTLTSSLSSSTTSSSTTTTTSSTAPVKTPTSTTKSGEGARATPMALIAGAIAAMAFLG